MQSINCGKAVNNPIWAWKFNWTHCRNIDIDQKEKKEEENTSQLYFLYIYFIQFIANSCHFEMKFYYIFNDIHVMMRY